MPDPLIYDIVWLALFGAVPLITGFLLLRSTARSDDASGRSAATFLTMLALVAAPLASLPIPNSRTAVVVFAPGVSPIAAYTAARAADAPVL